MPCVLLLHGELPSPWGLDHHYTHVLACGSDSLGSLLWRVSLGALIWAAGDKAGSGVPLCHLLRNLSGCDAVMLLILRTSSGAYSLDFEVQASDSFVMEESTVYKILGVSRLLAMDCRSEALPAHNTHQCLEYAAIFTRTHTTHIRHILSTQLSSHTHNTHQVYSEHRV